MLQCCSTIRMTLQHVLKKMAFETSHTTCFLVFSTLNARNFAFSTFDASALMCVVIVGLLPRLVPLSPNG